MYLSDELAGKIQETLAKFIAGPEPYVIFDDLNMRELAAELNLLPVMLDMGGCYAIRFDGQIYSFLWDYPYDIRLEDDPLFGTGLKIERHNIVCYCGNLGWLPPNYKTS